MHLYWRIQNDLDCLGEVIQFTDPGMIRSLRQWIRKNIGALVMAEDRIPRKVFEVSLN